MYFDMKSTLKSNHNYTLKQTLKQLGLLLKKYICVNPVRV